MATNNWDKSALPSRHVTVGPGRAPHRSYYYAMGMTAEEIARPFVAVASAGNDSAPCNTTLDAQADVCRGGQSRGDQSVVLHGGGDTGDGRHFAPLVQLAGGRGKCKKSC